MPVSTAAEAIETTLSSLSIGEKTTHGGLAMFPLVGAADREPGYLTLDEALAAGSARVLEVSEGGHVPELQFLNLGKIPVLILDGEELRGAKQNRVVNVTILAPAGKTTVIPVSCVERARWRYVSRELAASRDMHFASGRSKVLFQAVRSRASTGTYASDQLGVWEGIDAKMGRMGASSRTAAMADIYENTRPKVEGYVGALVPVERQVGAVFAMGDRVTGVELFDSAATLRRALPKLVRSHALDAIDWEGKRGRAPARLAAQAFFARVRRAVGEAMPGVGLGETVRIEGPGVAGAALAVGGEVLHLVAFRMGEAGREGKGTGGRPRGVDVR